ncbi:MAG: YIP1 family protein [Yoonia sp.]|uniref:YIP1 family protein n=1 Tax=Yoonia sp. TaxID=2212373 RepID=UPI003EF65005
MAVTNDIARTWRRPRAVIRDLLNQGRREDRAIAYLMISCFLIFVAQWPRLSRKAAGFDLPAGAEVPELDRLMAYEFLAWLMIWPLFLYLLAGLTHMIARAFGGKGTGYGARLALFWALLATVPALLLHGLMAGLVGPGPQTNLIGVVWLVAFLWIWFQGLREAESKP